MKHKIPKAGGHDLALLLSRIVLAMLHYVDDQDYDAADGMMGRVFNDYKTRKTEVHEAVNKALKYVTKTRFERVGPPVCRHPKPSEEVLKEVKQRIREVARKTWRTKKSA